MRVSLVVVIAFVMIGSAHGEDIRARTESCALPVVQKALTQVCNKKIDVSLAKGLTEIILYPYEPPLIAALHDFVHQLLRFIPQTNTHPENPTPSNKCPLVLKSLSKTCGKPIRRLLGQIKQKVASDLSDCGVNTRSLDKLIERECGIRSLQNTETKSTNSDDEGDGGSVFE